MKYIQYLKRGIKYILHGQPTQKVYAQITYLSPSDLLKGRTALITEGTSGLGYKIAKAFINAGAICVITGRDENKVQRTYEKINKEVSKKDHIFRLSWDVTDVKGNGCIPRKQYGKVYYWRYGLYDWRFWRCHL